MKKILHTMLVVLFVNSSLLYGMHYVKNVFAQQLIVSRPFHFGTTKVVINYSQKEMRKKILTDVLKRELEKGQKDINFDYAVDLCVCGADPGVPTSHGIGLLQFLVSNAQYNESTSTLLNQNLELVHDTCFTGSSPLHTAVRVGNVPAVEKLITCGAYVDRQDRYGFSPLHTLAYFNKKTTGDVARIALLLLQGGANVFSKNLDGKTSMDIAKENNNQLLSKMLHSAQRKAYQQQMISWLNKPIEKDE